MAGVNDVRTLLAQTSVPEETTDALLDDASAVWLMSAPADVLARDLVLCHPPIGASEVRAIAHPLDDGGIRLTVVAHDRAGLLADTAAVLATEGLSVSAASAMSWTASGLALHALTVCATELTEDRWTKLGRRLQGIGVSEPLDVKFEPIGRARVRSSPPAMGRCVVTVAAPDQVGLLWAICRWFADNDVGIEAARIGGRHGLVEDHFIVVGRPDARALAARLTGPSRSLPSHAIEAMTAAGAQATQVAGRVGRLAAGVPKRLTGQ